jgi:hypothetical protein
MARQGKVIPGPSAAGKRSTTGGGQMQNMKNVYDLLKDLEENANVT